MIVGIGCDIVEIPRLEMSIKRFRHRFISKLFTSKEQEYCNKFEKPAPSFAGRFAAKEAIAKALGVGFGEELSWLDIEIVNNEQGKPHVILSETIQKKYQFPRIHVSISHCESYAIAYAIYESGLLPEKGAVL